MTQSLVMPKYCNAMDSVTEDQTNLSRGPDCKVNSEDQDPLETLKEVSVRLVDCLKIQKVNMKYMNNQQVPGMNNMNALEAQGLKTINAQQFEETGTQWTEIMMKQPEDVLVDVPGDSRQDLDIQEATRSPLVCPQVEDHPQFKNMEAQQEELTANCPCPKEYNQRGTQEKCVRKLLTDMPPTCSQCPRAFVHLTRLRLHERTDSREKPYHCLHCGKSFAYPSRLKVHERTHTGEKPYHCSDCGKRFAQLANLQIHERIHTGEKPFKCPTCDEGFSQLANLQAHQKKHSRVMPFPCSECDKHFFNQHQLTTHQRTHTGERPYRCSSCGKAFTQLGNLRTHIKKSCKK